MRSDQTSTVQGVSSSTPISNRTIHTNLLSPTSSAQPRPHHPRHPLPAQLPTPLFQKHKHHGYNKHKLKQLKQIFHQYEYQYNQHHPNAKNSKGAVSYHPLPNAAQISASIPSNASSIFHIFDRRIDLDSLPKGTSIYTLVRCWVQDDPYRREMRRGLNLVDSVVLPSEQRRKIDHCVDDGGDNSGDYDDDKKKNGDKDGHHDPENGSNDKEVISTQTEDQKLIQMQKELQKEELNEMNLVHQTNFKKTNEPFDLFSTDTIGTSNVMDMKMYLREYITKGTVRRKRRNRLLKKRDEFCLRRLERTLGVQVQEKKEVGVKEKEGNVDVNMSAPADTGAGVGGVDV